MRLVSTLCLCACIAGAQSEVFEGELDGQPIVYRIAGGQAIFQDDIELGPANKPNGQRNASFFTGNLWPGGLIPYEIDPTIPASTATQLLQAISTWNAYGTPIRLQPRAGETDYTRFVRSPLSTGVCSSAVGRRGGMQTVTLEDVCSAPTIIHEIGHTVGLWHEQSRIDRNHNITVLYENISKNLASNYAIQSSAQDLASYEYASSMHYRPFSFSVDGRLTMDSVPAGIPMGEASGMNAADLDAVSRKYGAVPERTTITSNPPGLTLEVDGEAVVTPRSFEWARGSQHIIAVPASPQVVSGLQYVHGKWTDGGARGHTITASADVTVYTANLIRRFPVTVAPLAGGTATVNPPSPDGFYPSYTQVTLTAVPAPGTKFYRWTCAGLPSTSANPYPLPPRASSTSCIAQFTQIALTTIDSDPPGQRVAVDGVAYTAPINFQFAAGSEHTLGAASPAAGFTSRLLFTGWSDGATGIRPYTALEEGGVVTANFTRQFLLTLQQPSSLAGRISATPSSVDGFYDAGTTVALQFQLNAGYSLFTWTGDLVGNSNPATVVMDDQRIVAGTATLTVHPVTVLNSLTFQALPIAPGQIVSIFGTDLGPPAGAGPAVANGRVATESAGTRILFDGVPGPIVYTSPEQVNVVVPYSLTPGTITRVVAEYRGVQKAPESVAVGAVAPSIVSNGAGLAVVVNQDGSFNGPDRPARRGSVIVFFATGEGATTPAGVDGRVGVVPLARPVQEPSVRVGGKVAELLYAGNAPGFVAGAMQVNARIPEDAPAGRVSLYLIVGTAASPPVTSIYVE